jgi:hypothetical protein
MSRNRNRRSVVRKRGGLNDFSSTKRAKGSSTTLFSLVGNTPFVTLTNSLTGQQVNVPTTEPKNRRTGDAVQNLLPPNMKEAKAEKCAPTKEKKVKGSCLTPVAISTLQKEFNTKNPSHPIRANSYEEVQQKLVANTPTARTKGEKALLEGGLKHLRRVFFSPDSPKEWAANPTTWLTSDDINAVMKQWEVAYRDFDFLGPSPSDYDKLDEFGQRVWPELFKFDLEAELDRGRRRFGIIFNLDTHESGGSHWVSMFVNAHTRMIYYFDSTGEKIPTNIYRFVDQVQKQATAMGTPYTFEQNAPVVHQRGNTECGIYSLFFIVIMLQYSDNPVAFHLLFKNKNAVIPDTEMVKQRRNFFNRPS